MHSSHSSFSGDPHPATRRLMAAAWVATLVLAGLPWTADLIDPLPPLTDPSGTDALSLSLFILDASTRGLQRLWMVAAALALVVTTFGLVLVALYQNRRLRPLRRLLRTACLPFPALLLAIVVFVTMDA